jgi:hypothetical protein
MAETEYNDKTFTVEDLLADCGMFITGFLEIELITAGYNITDTELVSVTDIESDIPTYEYIFELETKYSDIEEKTLEITGETEQSIQIPVYLIDLEKILVEYPEEIKFPDNGLSQITEHEIGETIEETDDSNKTDISLMQALYILDWINEDYFDFNYVEKARNTNLYTALNAKT